MATLSPQVFDVLSKVAPVLAGAIGSAVMPGVGTVAGPMLANAAMQALGKTLGVSPTPEAINAKVEGELQAIRKGGSDALLREADLNLQIKQAQDVEFVKIASQERIEAQRLDNEDRANARAAFTATKDYTQKAIAFVVVFGFLACMGYAMWRGMPDGNRDLLLILAGTLTAAFIAVINYFFGSSQGSKRNADTLRNELAKKP